MKNRILSIIMAAMLAATALFGCGNNTTATADDVNASVVQATDDEVLPTIDENVQESINDKGLTIEENGDVTDSQGSKPETSDGETVKVDNETQKTVNQTNSASSSTGNNSSSKISTAGSSGKTSSNTNSKSNCTSTNNSSSSKTATTVAVTSVRLSKSSMSVTVGSSGTFTVTINPSNAANRNYTASTNNGNATVSCSGSTVTVKGVKAGSCTITVKSNNGKTATCSVTVKAKSASYNNSSSSSKTSNSNNSKEAQAKKVAKKIADASYKIARLNFSNPSDLELVSIASQLVAEYCRVCTYTTSDPDYSTAYGVFVKRVYTCAGSVRALGMVLECMGYSWTHVNENKWTHQWCELTMDGRKGWADAYNGYDGSYAIGAGYGDYDPSAGGDVLEQFGGKWQGKTTYISGSEESGKIIYKLTSWKTYYGLGDEQLIEFYVNDNYIKKQETINGSIYYEYNVKDGKEIGYKFTAELV